MKAASNKGGPVSTPVLSHIPMPRRKSSSKSDKSSDPNEADVQDCSATRSHAKMSLLGGSSFCCASGQKEDYLPEARIIPPKKRTPPVPPESSALAVGGGKGVPSQRKEKADNISQDPQSLDAGINKRSLDEIKSRPLGDSRLRPPDQRVRNPPSSPSRKISRDPLPFLEPKRTPDVNRKLRKDSPLLPSKDLAGRKFSIDSNTSCHKEIPPRKFSGSFIPSKSIHHQAHHKTSSTSLTPLNDGSGATVEQSKPINEFSLSAGNSSVKHQSPFTEIVDQPKLSSDCDATREKSVDNFHPPHQQNPSSACDISQKIVQNTNETPVPKLLNHFVNNFVDHPILPSPSNGFSGIPPKIVEKSEESSIPKQMDKLFSGFAYRHVQENPSNLCIEISPRIVKKSSEPPSPKVGDKMFKNSVNPQFSRSLSNPTSPRITESSDEIPKQVEKVFRDFARQQISSPELVRMSKKTGGLVRSTDECTMTEVPMVCDEVTCQQNFSMSSMRSSHDSEDLDCPCCGDKSSSLIVADGEINMFTSCEVVPSQDTKEQMHQKEVDSLKEALEEERMKAKNQQEKVKQLEEDLTTMEQLLRKELKKEKELRKIAEDKFLEMLDHERRIESGKCMVSKSTQMDDSDFNAAESSSLVMGYESQVRRYQSYIIKLEKDNVSLINELKKFKNFSPGSQEEQARLLIERLGEIQRSSHRQQAQYESCLDEVANRLVHTLLVQKRLEEECKLLHLRVEQLEHENGALMEVIEEDEDSNETNVIKIQTDADMKKQASNDSRPQTKVSSYCTFSSQKTPVICKSSKAAKLSKCTNTNLAKPFEPKNQNIASRIPAFGSSTKASIVRKKSRTENQPARTEKLEEAISSSTTDPNQKSVSSSGIKTCKTLSVKRKRLGKNDCWTDAKLRIKLNHEWDPDNNLLQNTVSTVKVVPPIQSKHDQIWSFNCKVSEIPEDSNVTVVSPRKAIDTIKDIRNENSLVDLENPNTSADGKTRDEGYSTMSSDLQPDTVISEPEHSTTCIREDSSHNNSDDCFDSSMCSSSDSGFGPLHFTTPLSSNEVKSSRNISTLRYNEPIASVKPSIRIDIDEHNTHCPTSKRFNSNNSSTNLLAYTQLSPLTAINILKKLDASLQISDTEKCDYSAMMDYWMCPNNITDITHQNKTLHKSSKEDQIVFHNVIQTAEKATLTEPVEGTWREKALAPYIDESIWSLYSSESDSQVKHFPLEPLPSECSGNSRPCAEDNQMSIVINDKTFKDGLERVASDTVLYLKDAIHELKDSMCRGLKSSKVMSLLHNTESGPETSRLMLNPASATLDYSHLPCPSSTRSSSVNSLQSSQSFHPISDDTDDTDILKSSGKGSQDPPDLISVSDGEYENVEHKDFVERWLQKEIAQQSNSHNFSVKPVVPLLEPVAGAAEFISHPTRNGESPAPRNKRRPRFLSYPPISKPHYCRDGITVSQSNDIDCTILGPEAKAFNQDFYKLCSIGSIKSFSAQANTQKHKPTGLVRSTRPAFHDVPDHSCTNKISPVIEQQKGYSKVKTPTQTNLKNSKTGTVTSKQSDSKEGYGTAWVHLQAKPELTDPLARMNLLDSLKTQSSSSGSTTEEEDDDESKDVLLVQTNCHLHKICRERRHKLKASANNPFFDNKRRTSIMGRRELFYRFGDKEREAIACFDFLEDLPTSSMETLHHPQNTSTPNKVPMVAPNPIMQTQTLFNKVQKLCDIRDCSIKKHSDFCKLNILGNQCFPNKLPTLSDDQCSSNVKPTPRKLGTSVSEQSFSNKSSIPCSTNKLAMSVNLPTKTQASNKLVTIGDLSSINWMPISNYRGMKLPNLWNQPLSHNMSSSSTINCQDYEVLDYISLSDSCAESYSSTPESFEDGS